MKKKLDERAAEKHATCDDGKTIDGTAVADFLAGVRYGRRTAVEAVKNLHDANPARDAYEGCERAGMCKAIDAIKKRSRK